MAHTEEPIDSSVSPEAGTLGEAGDEAVDLGFEVPDAAIDALNQAEADKREQARQVHIGIMKGELLDFCQTFQSQSAQWRLESYEARWHKYQRNSDAIYDASNKALKEKWQSTAFVPITPSHRESIQAALFRTIVGARPPLEMRSRVERENDQSTNIRDIILREMEKSRFEVEFNKVLEDATTFGSGFSRIRWETKTEPRLVRRPVRASIDPQDPQQVDDSFKGNLPIKEFEETTEPTVIYSGVRYEYLSIWDIFPDPKATEIPGSTVVYRFKQKYGDIVKNVQAGVMFPEAQALHEGEASAETEKQEKLEEMSDRLIGESALRRSKYGKSVESFELYGRIPRKWVFMAEPQENPEELIAARVIFSKLALMAVETAEEIDGEPPIDKLDYYKVTRQFFGRGIPEMLKDIQEVVNETVNQRIDNVSLVINRGFAVIEKAIVDRDDFVSKPGFVIRLNAQRGGFTDVRMAVLPLDIPDVTRSAYSDVLEMERYAQERTSANRVTLGTTGLVNDSNQTLGGQELLKQSASEKFAYLGMIMEFDYMYKVFRAYWKTAYANITPEGVIDAIGDKRALTFELLSPEQIDKDYVYDPQGIFTMENSALLQAKLQNLYALFAQQPWMDHVGAYDQMAKSSKINPDVMKLTPEDTEAILKAQAQMSGALGADGTTTPELEEQLVSGQEPKQRPGPSPKT